MVGQRLLVEDGKDAVGWGKDFACREKVGEWEDKGVWVGEEDFTLQKWRSFQEVHVLQSTEQHHWNLHSHLVVTFLLWVVYPLPQHS